MLKNWTGIHIHFLIRDQKTRWIFITINYRREYQFSKKGFKYLIPRWKCYFTITMISVVLNTWEFTNDIFYDFMEHFYARHQNFNTEQFSRNNNLQHITFITITVKHFCAIILFTRTDKTTATQVILQNTRRLSFLE